MFELLVSYWTGLRDLSGVQMMIGGISRTGDGKIVVVLTNTTTHSKGGGDGEGYQTDSLNYSGMHGEWEP